MNGIPQSRFEIVTPGVPSEPLVSAFRDFSS